MAKRTSEGKSRREAIRCLKRYIAREVYRVLMDPNPDGAAPEGPELAKMRKAMRVTEAGRRGARHVRGLTRSPGTWETAVDETGEEVLRAPCAN